MRGRIVGIIGISLVGIISTRVWMVCAPYIHAKLLFVHEEMGFSMNISLQSIMLDVSGRFHLTSSLWGQSNHISWASAWQAWQENFQWVSVLLGPCLLFGVIWYFIVLPFFPQCFSFSASGLTKVSNQMEASASQCWNSSVKLEWIVISFCHFLSHPPSRSPISI